MTLDEPPASGATPSPGASPVPIDQAARLAAAWREPGGELRPIAVIVADDHPMGRQGLRYYLEETGKIVVIAEAGDGEDALRLIEQHQPDVAVLDLYMPGYTGIEVARRAREARWATRILILTAYDDPLLVRSALEAGASSYFLKSTDPERIVEAVVATWRGETLIDPAILSRLELAGDALFPDSPPAALLLSGREVQVLKEVLNGQSDKEIARKLGINDSTVGGHLANIYKKLEVASRTQAITRALALGLVRVTPDMQD